MLLTAFDADGLRERVRMGASLDQYIQAKPDGVTLDASLELACAALSWSRGDGGSAVLDRWVAELPFLSDAMDAFDAQPNQDAGLKSAELWRIGSANDWLDENAGQQFLVRFERTLRHRGFSVSFAQGLSKAFAEMTDNVLQHSGARSQAPALAVAGFHIEHEWMTFAVADTGRGVLDSLRSGPQWAHIRDSREALSAVLERRATRRRTESQGHGFLEVFNALSSRNASLRFRSGDGCLTFDGELSSPTFDRSSSPSMPGFQLSVICALKASSKPRPVVAHALT